FESTLKEVVTAKRLSASRMNSLTDIALNCMENDTELVSILYRTHKTLGPTSKIHSLYAFDALARAARSKVNKLGLTGDINSENGNCATFLLKIDGVLDGLIQDMNTLGTPEAKEKTRKILDIWTKNNTFPPSVLNRLAELAKDAQKKGAYYVSDFVFAKYLFCYAITLFHPVWVFILRFARNETEISVFLCIRYIRYFEWAANRSANACGRPYCTAHHAEPPTTGPGCPRSSTSSSITTGNT
ncbi:hypothetical protein M422DRAFT_151875, partial [Sphaerobolus stellatus SS14]